MYVKNSGEFFKSLFKRLTDETADYKIDWSYFDNDVKENEFPYKKKPIKKDISKKYKLIIDLSVFCIVKVDENTQIRFSILLFMKKKDNIEHDDTITKEDIKSIDDIKEYMFVCDLLEKETYQYLTSTKESAKDKKELFDLYSLVELKMNEEVRVIENWIVGK